MKKNKRAAKIKVIFAIVVIGFIVFYSINIIKAIKTENMDIQMQNGQILNTKASNTYQKLSDVVEVGDYVDYDATNRYSYTSPKGTGLSHGNGKEEQTFKSSSDVKWRVLDKNTSTGEVTLISEETIKNTNKENFSFNGAVGYLYGEYELNNACAIYGHGTGANTSKVTTCTIGDSYEGVQTKTITGSGARSINVKDINTLTGYDEEANLGVKTSYENQEMGILYPTLTTSSGISSVAKSIGKFITNEYYYTLDTENTLKDVLSTKSGSSEAYWLATRTHSSIDAYGMKFVSENQVGYFTNILQTAGHIYVEGYQHTFSEYTVSFGIRPIVFLKTSLLTAGKNSDNEWTFSDPQTITVNKDGGTGGPSKIYVINGGTYSDSTCTTAISKITVPTKSGYKFTGYNSQYGGKIIEADGTINTDAIKGTATGNKGADYTITAQWEKIQTITLNKNGGTGGTNKLYVSDGVAYSDMNCTTAISKITIPTKSGYKFTGYKYSTTILIDANGTINANAIKGTATSNQGADYTMTAVWGEITLGLSTTSGTGYVGGSSLTATITGSNYGSLSIVANTNSSVATASIKGTTLTITPIAAGTTAITVKEANGNKTATYNVTVKATSISLNATSGICYVGGSNLSATASGTNMGSISATSNNVGIAKVSNSGNTITIMPVAAGTTAITVKEANGNKTATYNVTVKATSINLSETSGIGYVGGSDLSTTVSGTNMGNISATSNNVGIAKVSSSSNKITITPVAAGTTAIIVKEANGNKTATYNVTVKETSISLSNTSGYVRLNNTKQVTVSGENMGTLSASSNKEDVAIASINDKTLTITPKTVGTAIITVKELNGNKTATYNITTTNLNINSTTQILDINGVDVTEITAVNENAGTINWKSSNEEVATISAKTGDKITVTGKSNGSTVITAIGENDSPTATCEITVQTSPAEITLNKTEVTLDMNAEELKKQNESSTLIDKVNLVATISPETANVNKNLTWASNNEKVAKVDDNGNVTAVANGTAIITVTTENGKKANCEVTVQTSPTQITLSDTNIILDITKEKEKQLVATMDETVNANNNLTWTSSNNNIVTVDKTGKITGISNGTATITVTTENGKTASCEVTVQTSPTKLNIVGSRYIAKNNTSTYFVTFSPETASKELIKWNIGDEGIVKIKEQKNETIVLEGIKEGSTTLTAKVDNGETNTMVIDVTSLALDKESVIIDSSENKKVEIKAEGINAGEISWKVDNVEVLSLSSEKGDTVEVTALKNGIAKVTATGQNGNPTAECIITVQTSPTEVVLNKTEVTLDMSAEELKRQNENSTLVDKIDLIATIGPKTANIKTGLTWASNNEKVAKVDENGRVIAISNGTATITVTTENGKTANCEVTVQTSPTKVTLDKTAVTLNTSAEELKKQDENSALISQISLNATIEPETANVKTKLTWSSNNEKVAKVDENGKVTAISNGIATITVTTENEKTASCEVTVQTSPTEVTLNKTEVTLDMSAEELKRQDEKSELINQVDLVATIGPETANINKNLTWSSNNEKVAKVDENGKVVAISNGTATITVATENGKTAECKVTVQTSPTKVILNENKITLDIAEEKEKQLQATIEPETANIKTNLTWTSNNEKVVKVDETGKVTGISNGTATITVTTENGKTASCEVTVQTSPTEVNLNKTEATLDMSAEELKKQDEKSELINQVDLVATIGPETSNINKNLTWSSNNEKVAKVDGNGKVTGISNGTATITVATENGKTAECKVTVQTSPTKVTLNKTEVTLDMSAEELKGQDEKCELINKVDLVTTINPETANVKTNLTWTSNNEKVAKVDENGRVIAISNGTATITVTTENGKTANCEVTIQTSPTSLNIVGSNYIAKDNTSTYFIKYSPETTSKELIKWNIGDEEIIKIKEQDEKNIIIEGIKEGSTTLTANVEKGKSDTINIDVTSLKLDKENITINLAENNKIQIEAIGINAGEISWKVDNTEILSLSDEKGDNVEVTALKNGVAKVIATGQNGNPVAECIVTVQTSPTKITLDKTEVTLDMSAEELKKQDENSVLVNQVDLVATISPETANINRNLTWSSSDNKVAEVDNTGRVTAISNGIATITVTTVDGKTASCEIKVQTSPTSMKIIGDEYLEIGQEKTYKVIYEPETTSKELIKWSNNNLEVVTLDTENGDEIIVKAIKSGTSKLEVKSQNKVLDTLEIKVKENEKTDTNWKLGDINLDKNVDVTDLLLLKRHLVSGNKKEWVLNEEEQKRADMDQNSKVDITDLLLLKRELIK